MYKIYKIVNSENDQVYIGSTKNKLGFRFSRHKEASKVFPDRKLYKAFSSIGLDKFTITEIEQTDDKKKSKNRERFYILQFNSHIGGYNTNLEGRTPLEYTRYYRNKIGPQLCSCGSTYTIAHKARHEKTQKHLTKL